MGVIIIIVKRKVRHNYCETEWQGSYSNDLWFQNWLNSLLPLWGVFNNLHEDYGSFATTSTYVFLDSFDYYLYQFHRRLRENKHTINFKCAMCITNRLQTYLITNQRQLYWIIDRKRIYIFIYSINNEMFKIRKKWLHDTDRIPLLKH